VPIKGLRKKNKEVKEERLKKNLVRLRELKRKIRDSNMIKV
jgi:hypothetical protein